MNELGHQRFAYHALTQFGLGYLAQDVNLIAGEEESCRCVRELPRVVLQERMLCLGWVGS